MIFRDLPNYPGYSVSQCGVVKRCAGWLHDKEVSEKILRVSATTRAVTLRQGEGQCKRVVHTLVEEVWPSSEAATDGEVIDDTEFRPCKDFPGYAVSQCGIVKRVAGAFGGNRSKAKTLWPSLKRGTVTLMRDGVQHKRVVLGLVSEVWPSDSLEGLSNDNAPRLRMNWEARGYCHASDYQVRQLKRPRA